ncbi:AAA family ATPase [Leifsonia poae]|uniref:AAA family ATPase n=1 Tax=Leifsonia poae TaxID=110933 RepID=UPI0022F28A29|nr:AAA family ATPase [Leifsonia poae]
MKLIVLRGNSGSGKSTVARELRRMLGDGVALVEQDYLARTVLGQQKTDAGGNQELIALVARHALHASDAVVVEGMLSSARYAAMLRDLASEPGVTAWFYYFDVPFDETVTRHATRDKAGSFGADELRQWFVEDDLLPFVRERLIPAQSSAADTAATIVAEAGLRPGTLPG